MDMFATITPERVISPFADDCIRKRERVRYDSLTEKRTCEMCKSDFDCRIWRKGNRGRYCSKSCATRAHWAKGKTMPKKNDIQNYRQLVIHGHPLASANGQVKEHRAVLYAKIGPGKHPCHWCGKEVEWLPGEGMKGNVLIADHVDENFLNNDPDNLEPSCSVCNSRRVVGSHKGRVLDSEVFIERLDGCRIRCVTRKCQRCGVEFKARLVNVARGRGKYCSIHCRAKMAGRKKTK